MTPASPGRLNGWTFVDARHCDGSTEELPTGVGPGSAEHDRPDMLIH